MYLPSRTIPAHKSKASLHNSCILTPAINYTSKAKISARHLPANNSYYSAAVEHRYRGKMRGKILKLFTAWVTSFA